jgi:uncharacterized protein
LDSLAQRGVVLEAEISYARLSRFAELASSAAGCVAIKLSFGRLQPNWLLIRLELGGQVELICQRCLEPMLLTYDTDTQFALIESKLAEERLPEGIEPLILDDDGFVQERLIEDELIVSLPLAPRHEQSSECCVLAGKLEEQSADGSHERDVQANH